MLRSVHQQAGDGRFFVLNLRSVISADDTSLRLLAELQQSLATRGVRVYICHARALQMRLRRLGSDADSFFGDDDRALEECENLLLSEHGGLSVSSEPLPFGRCELLEGLTPHDISWLDAALRECRYEKGEKIVCTGDPGDSLYLLQAGSVEVRLSGTASKPGKRIDVFTAGMTFGEMAFIDGSPRSADVIALEPVVCKVLEHETFASMDSRNPALKISLLQQITRQLSVNLRRINAEVSALKG